MCMLLKQARELVVVSFFACYAVFIPHTYIHERLLIIASYTALHTNYAVHISICSIYIVRIVVYILYILHGSKRKNTVIRYSIIYYNSYISTLFKLIYYFLIIYNVVC